MTNKVKSKLLTLTADINECCVTHIENENEMKQASTDRIMIN